MKSWYSVFVLLIAIICWPLLQVVKEKAIDISIISPIMHSNSNDGTSSSDSSSGSPDVYNIIDLKAPAVAGPLLNIFGYILSRSFISPFALRYLLDNNGVHLIRELAVRECAQLSPTFYPNHKVNVTSHIHKLGKLHYKFLQTGLDINRPTHGNGNGNERGNGGEGNNTNISNNAASYRTIMDYHNLYKTGQTLPSEVMEEMIHGAERMKHLKIFSSFRPEDIRKQAIESDRRWKRGKPLSVFDGVPVAIKDMTSVAGHRLCRGSMIDACVEVQKDDVPAKRLRDAGAIHVGMTVMTEGGVTPLGYNMHWDGPFNPYDIDYYPGGSSSGSAVAVASGLVPMAMGFDGGGSVRIPASASGTMGLAVTHGRIPYRDASSSTMVKAGPLAATLEDVALTHLLLGQFEPGSQYSNLIGQEYIPPPHLNEVVDRTGRSTSIQKSSTPLKGTRIGVFWDHFQHTDPEIYKTSFKAVKHMEQLGAEIIDITIPYLREIHLSHGITILSEFGVIWEREFYDSSHILEANTLITIALGRMLTAAEILSAAKVRTYAMKKVCEEIFQDLNIDAIASPMLGGTVPKPGAGYRGYGESDNAKVYKTMRFVPLANFLGLPALVVPIGYERKTRLPIGFQLMGDAWAEHTLLKIGIHLEQASVRRLPPSENHHDNLGKFL